MKVLDDDKLRFDSTGRVVTANCLIIGIDHRGKVFDGYDGTLEIESSDLDSGDLTDSERQELSQYMIIRWQRFGASR